MSSNWNESLALKEHNVSSTPCSGSMQRERRPAADMTVMTADASASPAFALLNTLHLDNCDA